MSMLPEDLLPQGLEDRLPGSAAAAASVMRAIVDVLGSHGYERVQPPLIEYERSLAARMNGIAPQRMFRFVDPASLRMLALRSDITVQLGRIAATSLAHAPRPMRLCYAGQVLTIARGHTDPARERLQTGAELFGSDSLAAAIEITQLAVAAAKAAGGRELTLDLTMPDLLDLLADGPLPLPRGPAREAVRAALDSKDAGRLAELKAGEYLPLLAATGPFDFAIEKLAALDDGAEFAGRIARMRALAAAMPGDVALTLDPTERHGFEYQSWFGFTIYAEAVQGVLARGGSYRVQSGGETGEPAIGFSLYPDGLIDQEAAREAAAPQDNRLFVPLGSDAAAAEKWRADGGVTVAALDASDDGQKLGCSHYLDGGDVKPYSA